MANSVFLSGFYRINITPSVNTPIIGYYIEGGYESRASRFASGISELLVGKATETLKKI